MCILYVFSLYLNIAAKHYARLSYLHKVENAARDRILDKCSIKPDSVSESESAARGNDLTRQRRCSGKIYPAVKNYPPPETLPSVLSAVCIAQN